MELNYTYRMMSFGDHVQYDMITRKDGKRVPAVCTVIKGSPKRVPSVLPCCCGCGQDFSIDLFQINKDHSYGVNFTSLPCRAHRTGKSGGVGSGRVPTTPASSAALKATPAEAKAEIDAETDAPLSLKLPKPKLIVKPEPKVKMKVTLPVPKTMVKSEETPPLEVIIPNLIDIDNLEPNKPNAVPIGVHGDQNVYNPATTGVGVGVGVGTGQSHLVADLVKQNSLLAERNAQMADRYADLCSALIQKSGVGVVTN